MDKRLPPRKEQFGLPSLVDLLKQGAKGQLISFAGDGPYGQITASKEWQEAAAHAGKCVPKLDDELRNWPVEGLLSLREQLSATLARQGALKDASQFLLTSGPEQSIHLIVGALTEPGDTVLVECPAHPAVLKAFAMNGLAVLPLPCDEEGVLIPETEALIQGRQPKLIYAMPQLGDPSSTSWSRERSHALLALSRRNGIVVLEDHPYGELRVEKETVLPASLLSLDQEADGAVVLHTSSLSQWVGSAAHIGWIVGSRERIAKLALFKQAEHQVTDTATIDQHKKDQLLLDQLLRHPDFDKLLDSIRLSYSDRIHRLDELLAKQEWTGVNWVVMHSGMFLWLELPDGLHAETLLRGASARGVTFHPGAPFYASKPRRNRLRLNVANTNVKELEEGAERLAEVIDEFLVRGRM